MRKEEAVRFCLERVYCSFDCPAGHVEQIHDSQAGCGGGYDYRVFITPPQAEEPICYGSYARWGPDGKVTVSPNEESAVLRLLPDENGELAIFLLRFRRRGVEFRDWGRLIELGVSGNLDEAISHGAPDLIEVRRICSLEEIESLYGETTGGWRVEFYRERLPGEKAGEEGDRWVGILHRSNGSVTICRQREDFPF
jgi:hypothetical protein